MATCKYDVIGSIIKNCEATRGGIKAVYAASYQDMMVGATPNIEFDSTDKVWKFNANYTPAVRDAQNPTGWVKLDMPKQTGSMTSTYNIEDNGVKYVTTELSVQFTGIRQNVSDILDNMINSDDMLLVVATNAGKHILLGGEQAVTATGSTMVTGTAFGDLNGYTLTASDETNNYPMELKEDDFKKLEQLTYAE